MQWTLLCTVVICQSFCICVTIHAVHGDGSVRGTRSAMTREEISQLRATTVFDFYQAKLALFTSREHLNLSQLREYRSSLTESCGHCQEIVPEQTPRSTERRSISGYVRHNATIEICKALTQIIDYLHRSVDALADA